MTRKQTKLQLAEATERELRNKLVLLDREIVAVIAEKKQLEMDGRDRLVELQQARWDASFHKARVKVFKERLLHEQQRSLWSHVKEAIGF